MHQAQRALFPHQFSGGQRQRISIGRALASYPELIICDEPVSALDVAIQAQILNLFMDLQEKNNLTYLFISHDLGVVQHMCDDIGVMYLGRFAEVADKVSLFTSPAHPYTYSLLSVVPQVSRSPKGGRVKLLGDPPSPIDLKPGCRFNTRVPLPRTSAAMRSRNSGRSGTTISWLAIWSGTARPASAGRGVEGLTAARAGIGIARKRGDSPL
ncbi:MAG: oligopeptide/dipeptide ABC transporter ATP-binding protein [Bilophila wadsworthia]